MVIETDQFAQAQSTGQGTGFVGDALHQTAVAHEHVGIVIDDIVAGLIELRRQGALGDGETDRVGQALTQRAGGGLHARRQAILRVPRRF